jgi:hypothetical protein
MGTRCQVCGEELLPNLNNDVFNTCGKCRTLDLAKGLAVPGNVIQPFSIDHNNLDSIRLIPPDPAAYRLRRDSYGGLILQGLFAMQGNPKQRIWKDVPIVESDLPEEAE